MRLLLHIGTTKTGSTALQVFFAKNRTLLSENGVLYYEPLHRYIPWPGSTNGDVLLYLVYDKLGTPLSPETKQHLNEDCERIKENTNLFDTMLFSEETIWRNSLIHDGFWEAMIDSITEICGSEVQLGIVVFFRRQDDYLFSNWKENARSAWFQLERQFEQYHEYMSANKFLDYQKGVTRIENVLKNRGGDIILRRYDREHFSEKNIFHDFMEATALPLTNDYSVPVIDMNPSITADAAEALIYLKQRESYDQNTLRSLKNASFLYSKLYPEIQAVYPFSYDKRKALIDRYREGNDYLAKKYLGEESLFSNDIEEYAYRPYDPDRAAKNADMLLKLSRLSKEGQALLESTVIR